MSPRLVFVKLNSLEPHVPPLLNGGNGNGHVRLSECVVLFLRAFPVSPSDITSVELGWVIRCGWQ